MAFSVISSGSPGPTPTPYAIPFHQISFIPRFISDLWRLPPRRLDQRLQRGLLRHPHPHAALLRLGGGLPADAHGVDPAEIHVRHGSREAPHRGGAGEHGEIALAVHQALGVRGDGVFRVVGGDVGDFKALALLQFLDQFRVADGRPGDEYAGTRRAHRPQLPAQGLAVVDRGQEVRPQAVFEQRLLRALADGRQLHARQRPQVAPSISRSMKMRTPLGLVNTTQS